MEDKFCNLAVSINKLASKKVIVTEKTMCVQAINYETVTIDEVFDIDISYNTKSNKVELTFNKNDKFCYEFKVNEDTNINVYDIYIFIENGKDKLIIQNRV